MISETNDHDTFKNAVYVLGHTNYSDKSEIKDFLMDLAFNGSKTKLRDSQSMTKFIPLQVLPYDLLSDEEVLRLLKEVPDNNLDIITEKLVKRHYNADILKRLMDISLGNEKAARAAVIILEANKREELRPLYQNFFMEFTERNASSRWAGSPSVESILSKQLQFFKIDFKTELEPRLGKNLIAKINKFTTPVSSSITTSEPGVKAKPTGMIAGLLKRCEDYFNGL